MKPSQVRNTEVDRTTALATLIAEANKNNFGKRDPYNLKQGIGEFSREFMPKGKALGCCLLKDELVFFINEPLLTPDQEKLVRLVSKSITEMPGVYVLKQGKVSTLRHEPEFVREAYRTENGD